MYSSLKTSGSMRAFPLVKPDNRGTMNRSIPRVSQMVAYPVFRHVVLVEWGANGRAADVREKRHGSWADRGLCGPDVGGPVEHHFVVQGGLYHNHRFILRQRAR